MISDRAPGENTDPYVGRVIDGQFRIIKLMGRGGMSAVYEAEQPSMNRKVAVKILQPRYKNRSDLVSRFFREARAMSQLTHPNTARVFVCGELEDGMCYFVMEYLEGKNLSQALGAEGPFEVTRAIRIITQVCGALSEAHNLGIVHRDIKPENIFLTVQGGITDFPKVLDFGLAKVTEQQMRPGSMMLTQDGMVFGTPEFMSPEQARGEKLDARSDLYSLTIVLYELLTGKLPFDGQTPIEFIQAHLEQAPLPMRARITDRSFPKGLNTTLMKGLAKKRDDRYPDAQTFAQVLSSFLNPVPTVSKSDLRPISNEPGTARLSHIPRYGWWAIFIASALVLGVTIALVTLLFLR